MKRYIVDDYNDRTEWKTEDGRLHREDGPAIEWKNGNRNKMWFFNDKLHRTDGPAVEWYNGTKEWYIEGKRHRLDGPAIEFEDGAKSWWVEDKLHRLDGPANEYANGHKEWYIEGEQLSESEFNKRTKPNREFVVFEVGGVKYKLTKV